VREILRLRERLGSTVLLSLVLALCLVRLWVMPLPSSFWVDEMVSAFVVHFGASHPSLAVAPQVTETIYYWLPRTAESIFGFSEIVYRIPSLLVLGIALWLIAKLAARLIHPQAGWFAVFACLALKGFDYQAADARPYALGTCVAAASLYFLIRWMDGARWPDALLFTLFGALLWRVHLVFWPFYGIYAMYVAARMFRRETPVPWKQVAAVGAMLAASLIPVAIDALRLARDAQAHVVTDPPQVRDLRRTLKFLLLAQCGGGALIASFLFGWRKRGGPKAARAPLLEFSSWILILGWWLWHPLTLFAYSRLTGNSLFVDRYLSLALPGAALAATVAAALSLPESWWRPCAAVLGACVLAALGQWLELWPAHHNSDWRDAARTVNEWTLDASTPVLLPSPFIEAKFPVWRPDYPLPGFLYSYLPVYKLTGKPYLLPFQRSPEAENYAATLAPTLAKYPRFLIYGGDRNVFTWRNFFASRPELKGWGNRTSRRFGDVAVEIFENPEFDRQRTSLASAGGR
jgi:hypothetical protein